MRGVPSGCPQSFTFVAGPAADGASHCRARAVNERTTAFAHTRFRTHGRRIEHRHGIDYRHSTAQRHSAAQHHGGAHRLSPRLWPGTDLR